MSRVFLSGFRKLCPFLVIDFRPHWGLPPRALGLGCALLLLTSSHQSWAKERAEAAEAQSSTHILLGPQVAAIAIDSEWDSEIGAELHLTRLRTGELLSVLGAGLGAASFSRGETLQLSFDLYVGTGALYEVPLGLSVGSLLKAFDNGRPQLGARTTLWIYHGVMPYLSLSWLRGPNSPAQPGVEIGLKIPFSIWDW